jgi:hypothetical protein
MIDRHYGHLARDGREHAITLLDTFTRGNGDVHAVDVSWTFKQRVVGHPENMTTV